MRVSSLLLSLALLLPLGAAGCGKGHHHHEKLREVSLTFVVTDSDGYAWKNVIVRLDEAWNEWNDCICPGVDPYAEQLTDANGEVYFGSADIAKSDLGFQRSEPGVAVLSSRANEDEAVVKVLVGHDTIGWVEVDVPLRFHESNPELWIKLDPIKKQP